MPRYIGQKHDGQCAPIAILNAERWAGAKSIKNRLDYLIRLCKSDSEGTEDSNFDKAIRRNPYFSVQRMYKPTIPRLREHVSNGAGAFYSYDTGRRKEDEGHTIFIPGVFRLSYSGWIVTNILYATVLRVSNRLFLDDIWQVSPPDERLVWLVWPK